MKIIFLFVAALFLSGCTSEVRVYDAGGRFLGKCEAERSFFLGNAGASCIGSANPTEQSIQYSAALKKEEAQQPPAAPRPCDHEDWYKDPVSGKSKYGCPSAIK